MTGPDVSTGEHAVHDVVPRRAVEAVAAVASVAVLVGALVLLRADQLAVGILLILAVAFTAAPIVLDVLVKPRPTRASPDVSWTDAATSRVTTIVRLGGEPLEVARPCITLAAAGPAIVVTATDRTDLDEDLAALGVPLVRGDTVEAAVAAAVESVSTDGVLLVSASTVPLPAMADAAAGRLRDRCAWVVGRVRPLDTDAYAPDTREALSARLRSRARASGLDLWERDATIVRTDLLRAHSFARRRPAGRWMRAMRAQGHDGATVEHELALRAAPAGAGTFWSSAIPNARGRAGDLADALTDGPRRARVLALAQLLRELYAYPLLVWMLAPLLVALAGDVPFRGPVALLVAVYVGVAVLRWYALRHAYRLPLRPVSDLLAAAYDAPGSIAAIVPTFTRRVTPVRTPLPSRPLVWAAIALMAVAALAILGARGLDDVEVVAGLALLDLVVLWLLALRALAQWRWSRRVVRVPLVLSATVADREAVTVDVSPTGLAVAGERSDLGEIGQGRTVPVGVRVPDGRWIHAPALVVDRRHVGGRTILGLSLRLDTADRIEWVRQVFAALGLERPGATLPEPRRAAAVRYGEPAARRRAITIADRVALALVGVLSLVGLLVLLLVVAGYRPLVVRSDSMLPTFGRGDLIVVEETPARDVRVDDVVTFTPRDGDSITHRVRAIEQRGGRLVFETRGDANERSERFVRRPDATVATYRLRVAGLGAPVLWLDGSEARLLLIGVAGFMVLAVAARAALEVRRNRSASAR